VHAVSTPAHLRAAPRSIPTQPSVLNLAVYRPPSFYSKIHPRPGKLKKSLTTPTIPATLSVPRRLNWGLIGLPAYPGACFPYQTQASSNWDQLKYQSTGCGPECSSILWRALSKVTWSSWRLCQSRQGRTQGPRAGGQASYLLLILRQYCKRQSVLNSVTVANHDPSDRNTSTKFDQPDLRPEYLNTS